MDKLRRKPTAKSQLNTAGKFERFNLSENPFPSEPVVNKESSDKRINGEIYESALREPEFKKLVSNFLLPPMAEPQHLRLGYIIDSSYIGRGNGKSAFLVHLQQTVNEQWGLDLSNGVNKCFALHVTPEPGGRTKSFISFVDAIADSLFRSHIIRDSLAALRLNAIAECYGDERLDGIAENGSNLVAALERNDWYQENKFDLGRLRLQVQENAHLQSLPPEFPLFLEFGRHGMFAEFVTEQVFEQHYHALKRPKEKLLFIFSHLVRLFQAADFTGACILIDDFERVPDFQSARQRKDFAIELRSVVYDGPYHNANVGFYTFLLVLHAGVPALISDAWAESGMENRSPLSQQQSRHIISFEKINKTHVELLLKRYLDEYRMSKRDRDPLKPFTKDAIQRIGELTEYNAAKILGMSYSLLDRAVDNSESKIDAALVETMRDASDRTGEKTPPTAIEKAPTTDLLKKASESSKE